MADPTLARALKDLAARGVVVGPRENMYNGQHPQPAGTLAWRKAYGSLYAGVIDNQTALVCNQRAGAVRPANFVAADDTDALAVVEAQGVSDLLDEQGATVDDVLRTAFWSGEQTSVIVDFDDAGRVVWYLTDPRTCWVDVDKAGGYRSAVHVWQEPGQRMHATVYTPKTVQTWRSDADSLVPSADVFRLVDEAPNRFGDIPVASVTLGRSLVDAVKAQNLMLNKSLQMAAVAGESYVSPFRAWFGIDTFDPATGEVKKLMPQLNPGTGSRDLSIPSATDEEGAARSVTQFTSPTPGVFLEEQENLRASIARLGAVPAFMLQISGQAPSGDALEQAYLPFVAAKAADERVARPFFDRLAALTIRRRVYAKTGVVLTVTPLVRTVFSSVATSTVTARVQHVKTAVDAGMPLADALVEFMGWSRDAADAVAEKAALQAQEAAAVSTRLFDAGVA